MFHKTIVWVALTIAAFGSAVLALRLFPVAFPIVQLELTMDREAALEAARGLAARESIGPRNYRQAASFASDSNAQTFIELEGGGKEALATMLREGFYEVHSWRIRHFQEGQKYEAVFRFRPDGRPYGFVEHLEETAPGAALDAETARGIGERNAVRFAQVDLQPFTLVEASREQRSSGRVDHAFTYERARPALGEGRYRLRLVVSGDRLTEVTHFIRIPEAFERRYDAMRSANEAIGAGGSIAMVVLYLIGGVGIGLFWLLRERWVVARPAIVWGIGVAALQTLASLNQFPLAWMSYDTAVPRTAFISQHVAALLGSFAGFSTLFAFSFMAAESLTRRAFGDHPQLWRVWSRDAAASTAILGRTVAGYLLVAVFFAYDVLLYFYATRWFGWWTPSDALIHPDILATYLPWLSAIANSLQAGFWEEALFRAVPIAGAALVGDKFGRRGLFIVIAFVIQTIVFGAGHAPYPTQPSYARPVELILPSIGFGLIYLRFGLLPAIVLHYAFDVVWMALPLFVSTASGIWIDRTIVVLLTLVPLLIVIGARIRGGHWVPLQPAYRNASWVPLPPREATPIDSAPAVILPIAGRRVAAWLIVGAAAVGVWAVGLTVRPPYAPLTQPRDDAEQVAREALTQQGVALDPTWRVLPRVQDGRTEAHEFVWENAGSDRFHGLLGRYLSTPRWNVRIATFEGDVANAAEEWAVLIGSAGRVERIEHQLPESRPGASLGETEARTKAIAEIERVLQVPAASLREVSAQPAKLSARTDWLFTFEDVTVEPIRLRTTTVVPANDHAGESRGEARIQVSIAGDEVVRVQPFIRVPEAWQRERRSHQTFAQIAGLLALLLGGSALVSAAVAGIMSWSRRRGFNRRLLVIFFALYAMSSLAVMANSVPATIAQLPTARPLDLQLAMLIGVGLVGVLLPAVLIGLAAGTLPYDMVPRRSMTPRQTVLLGIAAGAIVAGFGAALRRNEIPWSDFSALGTYLPLLAWAVERLPTLIMRTIVLLALLTAIDDFSNGWTRHRAIFGLAIIVAGALLGVPAAGMSFGEWIIAGAAAGIGLLCAYLFLFRDDLSLVPVAMATAVVLGQLRGGLMTGTANAFIGSLAGALLTALTGWWMYRLLRRDTPYTKAHEGHDGHDGHDGMLVKSS